MRIAMRHYNTMNQSAAGADAAGSAAAAREAAAKAPDLHLNKHYTLPDLISGSAWYELQGKTK